MSRVEPKERDQQRDAREEEPRKASRTPGQAEGEESTVDEALRKSDYDETLKIPKDRA
jgi:hypothetical protein